MSYTEGDIAYERGAYWALRVPRGKLAGTFEVYRAGVTHSTRCAIIGYRGEDGRARAIAECDRRAAMEADTWAQGRRRFNPSA